MDRVSELSLTQQAANFASRINGLHTEDKAHQAAVARVIATKPRNWRERQQKARVIASLYKRRKREPVWDESLPF